MRTNIFAVHSTLGYIYYWHTSMEFVQLFVYLHIKQTHIRTENTLRFTWELAQMNIPYLSSHQDLALSYFHY